MGAGYWKWRGAEFGNWPAASELVARRRILATGSCRILEGYGLDGLQERAERVLVTSLYLDYRPRPTVFVANKKPAFALADAAFVLLPLWDRWRPVAGSADSPSAGGAVESRVEYYLPLY